MKTAGITSTSCLDDEDYEVYEDDEDPSSYSSNQPVDNTLFMEGLLKKRGDVTKAFRERWVVLHWDEELGYILSYSECEQKEDGSVGPKEGDEPKVLIVRGANLRAKSKIKGNAKYAIGDRDRQKLCLFFQEGPGGRSGDKVHVFLFETDEELKEWTGYLKMAVEKTIKWSGNAGPMRMMKNAMTSMTDTIMGTASKTFSRQMKQHQRKEQADMSKSIKNFTDGLFGK
ncbi:PH domain-containing protein [Chloropicon primus]|uniref:PH domain-containing protein n=1 Tax=Chloropicon primus TaxID=1764295 RepID=A0A5B8MW99_9CHLO|nr:hypothetical protein A3770_14p72250 [Chloropicon primus]UPR03912.1 PH domain-containing protein [Chloropicon primus]|eukprot:QDZ24707.1 hypothetical protein A3770_14p72250 [Chloropicon primus]